MLTRSTSQVRILVAVCALLVLACAGLAIAASNMGFKVVKPIVIAGSGSIGDNWTALPFKNPYANVGVFCNKVGLITAVLGRASITVLNENTGGFQTVSCGTSQADALTLIAGKGIKIRQPPATGAPTNIIIAGSHDNNLQIVIPKAGSGQIGNFWFSVPYHTTYTTAADLCQNGNLSPGPVPAAASITRLNASTGALVTANCGSAQASALMLQFGEFVQIRDPGGPKTFTPSHY